MLEFTPDEMQHLCFLAKESLNQDKRELFTKVVAVIEQATENERPVITATLKPAVPAFPELDLT